MPNVQAQNYTLFTSNEEFSAIWKLTRIMKAAGWRYKASSDSQATTIAAGSNGLSLPQATINVASTTGFQTSGTITVVTGAGPQTVTYTGTNSTQFTGCSGGTGTMSTGGAVTQGLGKDTTGNPSNDRWGGGVQVGAQTAMASFTIGTPTTTSYGGRSTITGLTGFTTASVGRFLVITGATNGANNGTWLITNFLSATSVVIENPAAIAETTPGTATWTEVCPCLDTFPVSLQGAVGIGDWWCAQGPSTLKVPIGATSPTGTFIRGENVTQATTGATGEYVGVVTDTGGLGYMVILPRLSGTGAGPRGWSASATITGARSSASIAPTGTIIEYVREIVFWKASSTTGHIYFQTIDQASEAAATTTMGRFSVLAALGTTTSIICPGGATGGNPTTNGFPTIGTVCVMGTGGSGAAATGAQVWAANSNAVNTGLAQILVANAIEDAGVSSDGSITFALGLSGSSPNVFVGWGFQRLDDTEDGDVDPYIFCIPTNATAFTKSRTAGNTSSSSTDVFTASLLCAGGSHFFGWRRRGMPTDDAFQEFQGANLGSTTVTCIYQNPASADRVACAFTNIPVREPIWVYSAQVFRKQRKGSFRWWFVVQGGNGTDTYDGKKWIQLSSNLNGPIIVGPADQTTNVLNG